MSAESKPDLREMAREEPDAVWTIAERAGGELQDWLERVLNEENPGWLTNKRHGAFVYIVESKPGVVKIGRSKNPEVRLQQLNVGSPDELELLEAVRLPNAKSAERQLHEEYQQYKVQGEWFDVGPETRDELVERLSELQGLADGGSQKGGKEAVQ